MDPSNVPIELISYRGLLKSLDQIKSGKLFKNYYRKSNDNEKHVDMFILKSYAIYFMHFVENFLFHMMDGYDNLVYTPLQKCLSPIVTLIPREIDFGNNFKLPVFTVNVVTFTRTFLIVPIAWCLKFDMNGWAFLCVVFHDFLDHLDGIVAKVHKTKYPGADDPLLGGFLDAFCDKIVNVISLCTIIQSINFNLTTFNESIIFLFVCYGVCVYEIIIGIVRVQDYFTAKVKRDLKIEATEKKSDDKAQITASSMEGKLKEKLESMGIAFLCMSASKLNSNPINNIYGIVGLICLALTLRMAHKSLTLKLKARNAKPKLNKKSSADNLLHLINSEKKTSQNGNDLHHPNFEATSMKMVNFLNDQIEEETENYNYKKKRSMYLEDQQLNKELGDDSATAASMTRPRTKTVPNNLEFPEIDTRVDRVYTIGCFDLFHHGHVNLIQRMRKLGKKVIVGVHDSRSIFKLKNRVPVDSTEKRMLNVKTVADEVFCIADTDPSNYMTCIVSLRKNETGMFVRGDDMPNFPSRQVVENLMPIKLLPYTEGVSSTQIRKEKYSHIASNDLSYLEKNE